VAAQIACAALLVVGAGLLARTVSMLAKEDLGISATDAVEAKIVLSDRTLVDGSHDAIVGQLVERVRAIAGVDSAGIGSSLPPREPPISITIRLVNDERDSALTMRTGSVTAGYLKALGARFLAGHDFEAPDEAVDSDAVILSESAARFLFPGRDA